jgi:hypothetical protein
MTLLPTLALLVLGLAIAGRGWWRLEHPPDLPKVSLVPPALVMGLGVILVILMIAHLITLETGVPFVGRRWL